MCKGQNDKRTGVTARDVEAWGVHPRVGGIVAVRILIAQRGVDRSPSLWRPGVVKPEAKRLGVRFSPFWSRMVLCGREKLETRKAAELVRIGPDGVGIHSSLLARGGVMHFYL